MATKAELFQAAGPHTGLLIAVWLEPELAATLAIEGGEPPEQLHLTICYCGDANAMTDVQVARAIAAVSETAMMWGPLSGQIAGVGRFNATESSDGKDVLYANVDVPGLAEMRSHLASSLDWAGAPPLRNHGYTPHITLAYMEQGADLPIQRIDTLPFAIRSLWVGVGDKRTEIPLAGSNKSVKVAQGGDTMDKHFATGKVKEINLETRSLTAYASTSDIDRDGEVIAPEAWRKTIQQFPAVPLIWAHDYRIPPIGKATGFEIDGRGLKFRAEFANTPFAQEIWGLYAEKYLNSFSVGFIPKQATEGQQQYEPNRTYTETELLEVSAVAVPANPFAAVERGVPVVAFKSVDSLIASAKDANPATTEDTTADPPAATTTDPAEETPPPTDELTPAQEQELAELLAQVTDELTGLFTGD